MKIIMRQIIGLLLLLSGVLSLDAMFTPSKRASQAYLKRSKPQRNFVSKSSLNSVDATVGRTNDIEMQQPSSSFWGSITSPFKFNSWVPTIFMPEKISAQEINELLMPSYPGARVDKNDFVRAKTQLGYIINSDPSAKSYIVETTEDNGVIRSLTILDKVLFILSQLIKSELPLVKKDEDISMLTRQRMWYFTELIKSLARVDAQINQENSDIYLDAFKTLLLLYRKALDQQFKEKSHGYTATSVDAKVEFLQKELTDLTSIFRKLIPGFEKFKLEIKFTSWAREFLNASRREKNRQKTNQQYYDRE